MEAAIEQIGDPEKHAQEIERKMWDIITLLEKKPYTSAFHSVNHLGTLNRGINWAEEVQAEFAERMSDDDQSGLALLFTVGHAHARII